MFDKIIIFNLYVPFPLINVANKQLVPGKKVPMNEIKDKIIFKRVYEISSKTEQRLLFCSSVYFSGHLMQEIGQLY